MQLPCDTRHADEIASTAMLEALLFLSGKSMSEQDIMDHTGWTAEQIHETADALSLELSKFSHGIMVIRVAGGYQLVTKPALFDAVQWVRTGTANLSATALEVLAIVAFKQPITRAEIEQLRGVSSERVLASLVQQGLVVDLGRRDTPGRPILYGTSAYFLECIGMDSLADLAAHISPGSEEKLLQPASETKEKENRDGKTTEGNE